MSYPKLISKLYSPKVLWGQNDVTVVLRILLHDVDEYYLRLECDHLLFRYFAKSRAKKNVEYNADGV